MRQIVKKKTSVICVVENKILGFLAEDLKTHLIYFFLPGGKPQHQESLRDCAIRETREETGYAIHLIAASETASRYLFTWNGIDFDCMTTYFAATLYHPNGPEKIPKILKINDAPYHKGQCWVKLDTLKKKMENSLEIYNTTYAIIEKWF